MGNNRQVLKNSLEQLLQKNIHTAKELLTDLRGAVQQVENNSATAKGEVHQTVDEIQQLLVSRKLELTRQIDLLCRTQINSLQEDIQDVYIALGSLQGTLLNLDSFDHSQLQNLNIHDLSLTPSLRVPLELNVDSKIIKKELEQWGSVNNQGFKGLIDVGTSASMPRRFVDYCDKKSDREMMCHKSVSTGPSIECTFTKLPKIPFNNNLSSEVFHSSERVVESTEELIASEKWHLEKWLTEIKSESCPENEDFELVSVENLSCNGASEKVLNSFNNDDVVSPTEDKNSSIICMESVKSEDNLINDLSKWLKPKKINISENIAEVRPVNASTTSDHHDHLNNRFVDFPCLRLDHKYWVPSKKTKSALNSSQEISFEFNEKDVIPPTYALPAPFWLKKYH